MDVRGKQLQEEPGSMQEPGLRVKNMHFFNHKAWLGDNCGSDMISTHKFLNGVDSKDGKELFWVIQGGTTRSNGLKLCQ